MFKHTKKILASLFILAGITLFISCQDDQSIPTANDQSSLQRLAEFSLPPGVTLTSATLFVYEELYDNDHVVNVHKVTSDWEETTVTWNTKPTSGGALTSFNSFPGAGWRSVEITALVQDWIDNGGNYGLLLDEAVALGGYCHYNSKENAVNHPYLHVVTSAGTFDLAPIADASIWENEPDNNKNTDILTVGRSNVTGFIKQSLIQFEYIPVVTVCETAYAFGDTPFCGLPNIGNWGWTEYINGNYTNTDIPIYAGAAQCDPTKGTRVGTLSITYVGTSLTVNYTMNPGITVNNVHMWIGSTELPVKNGKLTSAPGQFNYNNQTFPFNLTKSNPFYIAVHFDVCWEE